MTRNTGDRARPPARRSPSKRVTKGWAGSRSSGVLSETAFLRLWAAQSIPGLGDGILVFVRALLILQGAQQAIQGESDAPGVLGLSAMLAAPMLGTAPAVLVGGELADRVPRRPLVLVTNALATAALLPLALVPDPSAALVAIVILAVSAIGALQGPASLAWQTQLIRHEENLQKANSLRALSTSAAALLAPALGGLLVTVADTRAAVWAVMLIYGLGTVALLAVPAPPRLSGEPLSGERPPTLLRQLGAGFVALGSCRWARILLLWMLVVNVLVGPANVLANVVLADRFGGSALVALTAGMQTAATAGSLVGTALLLRWRPRRPGRALLVLAILDGLDGLVLVWSRVSWPIVVFEGLAAGGQAVYPLLWLTAMQRRFPNDILGRVIAASGFSMLISVSAGLFLAVPVAALFEPEVVLIVTVVILVASVLVLQRIPGVADLRDPGEPEPPTPAKGQDASPK